MISSVGLTISGLIFTLLIAIIYFSKKKYNEVENKLFGFLLLLTIFLLLLEFYCVFTMRIRNLQPVLNEILCRMYVLGVTIWFFVIAIYVIVLTKKEKYHSVSDLFKAPIVNILMIICFGTFIVSCFLPLTYSSGNNQELYVIGGKAVFSLYFVSMFVGAYLVFILFSNKNKISFFKRLPILFFFAFYFIMLVIQYFYTDINELTFVLGLSVVALYFTIVSQDYKLVTDLEVAKIEAESANRDKTDFLSKMSHEIRTPMNAIMGFSEALLNDKDVTEQKIVEDARNIYIAGNNLVSTINNILDVSNIESGKEVVEDSKYYIGDIIYNLKKYADARIDKTKINFVIDFDQNTPLGLSGDSKKIYKVLLNILSNSTRYTTDGEIKIKEECICDKGIAYLKFVISDTGVGIKEEDFEKVYTKFSKLETDIHGLERGAGLGLTIAKSLVELMGGQIAFTSQYGVGTTFTIEIKNKILDYHKCGDIFSKNNGLLSKEDLNFKNKKVMVVDDNKLNLKVADKFLRSYNIDVTLVESGSSCIERLSNKEEYDLILLDHMMPDLDGIDTLKELKKKDISLPPIIVTAANIDNELKETFVKEGFDGYLTKPLDADKLKGLLIYYFKK